MQLNDQAEFVQWTEPEWENKRKDLAAISPPIKDFPFPGYVASDKLHWLRAEYHATTDDEAKKESLARDLLERAQTLGDKNEAARWRNVLKVNQK